MKTPAYPRARASALLTALALVGVLLGGTGLAQVRPAREPLPNFDLRSAAAPKAEDQAERQRGLAHLAEMLPSARTDFHPLLGSPRFVRSQDGFLTGPQGQGRAVSTPAAHAFSANDPHLAVKSFLSEHVALFGHGPEALQAPAPGRKSGAHVAQESVGAHNGLRTVVWQQEFDGLPIFEARFIGNVTKLGELVSVASQFLPDPARSAGQGTPAGLRATPPFTAAAAILKAAASLGETWTAADVVPAGGPVGEGNFLVFKTPREAYVRQVWLPLDRGRLRLA